jgi:hypothetical protein
MAVTRAQRLLIEVGDPTVLNKVSFVYFYMAMTEAKSLLIVVGDPHVLVQVSFIYFKWP